MSSSFSKLPWLFFVLSLGAHAATLTYAGADAGMPAPCNAKLQDCLTGSAPGDTIEIATNTPIVENNLYIPHSLTLKSKAGFTGTIGPPGNNYGDLTLDDTTGVQSVILEGLDLSKVNVWGNFQHFAGDSLTVTNATVGFGLNTNASQPFTLVARHNKLIDVGAASILDLRQSSNTDGTSITLDANEIYSPSGAANSMAGMDFLNTGTGSFTLNVTNNLFHDLSGCNCGTPVAIELEPFASGAASQVNIVNNTFDTSGNGGIYVTAPGSGNVSLQIYNNAFTNFAHYAYYFPASSPHLSIGYGFNHLFGATEVLGGYTTGGGSDTSGDPLYVNRAAHDYRLQPTSPLLNSGFGGASGEPTTDFTGNPRITEGVVDRGAYERNADLSVLVSGNPLAPAVNTDVTYTVTLTNHGPYDVTDGAASLALPAGLLFKSATLLGGNCSGSTTVTCTAGAVPSGAAVNATIVATATTKGDQNVTATVSGGPSDPNTQNNSATLVTHTGQVMDAGTPDGGTGGEDKKGCGCTATSAELPGMALLLALGALTRRRSV